VEGPALLIPNHVTWVDALLLCATNQRRACPAWAAAKNH
jgi:acyl-[acyl-carrier-protein]-phospholipid O-acyltransferase/long-chain-fatty-acid--[acyl-carrier-protein] ligase